MTDRRKKDIDPLSLIYGKLPPQAIKLEDAIIGSCMTEPGKIIFEIARILKPSHFYNPQNEMIYEAIISLFNESTPPDVLMVCNRLKDTGKLEQVGGPFAVTRKENAVTSSANTIAYARIVFQKWVQRKIIHAAGVMLTKAYDDSIDPFDGLDSANDLLMEIETDIASSSDEDFETVVFKATQQLLDNDGTQTGIKSGFPSLDKLMNGGWQNKFIVIAGRPAMGKTALLIQLALLIAETVPVGIIELEATRMEVVVRMLSNKLGKSASYLKKGNFNPDELAEISNAASDLIGNKVFIDFNPDLDIIKLRAKVRYWVKNFGVKIVFIDYLQIIEPGNERDSREQQVSKMSRALQKLSKELDIPIIAFAQLGRDVEKRGNPTPRMSDLRESGGIENNARVVMFIHRPEYYDILIDEMGESTKGKTKLIVAKNNEGETGVVDLNFSGATNTFFEEEKFIPAPRF